MVSLHFQEATEQVKSSLDIIDIVQRHVVLKKAGRNYTGLCPFHKDKHPSMNVSREKNLFKCFSCGAGGDALTFLMRIENKTFGEVIRDLASERGIDILADGKTEKDHTETKNIKQKVQALNTRSNQWFQIGLQSQAAESVRQYLERRQMTANLITRFELGYAPAGWENLVQHLKNTADEVKQNPELLITAGLANQRTNELDQPTGTYYDRFRNRLIIPIHDEKGQVVAFGGRALSDEDKPKYLNSPETPIYHKSRILYGLNRAKDTIRESHSAIVMEGYFDVLSAHAAGITQAVGACGTALTDQHLKLLTRFGAETIYLAFDSDEAGIKAALSGIQLIEPYIYSHQISLKVIMVPSGKDPDDFIRTEGAEAFRQLIQTATSWLDFRLAQSVAGLNCQTAEGRIKAATQVVPILTAIPNQNLQQESIRAIAERIGVAEEALRIEIRRYQQSNQTAAFKKRPDLQNFSGNGAIFNPVSTSYKQKTGNSYNRNYRGRNQLLLENTTAFQQALLPRHQRAERDLLRLMLFNTPCFQLVSEQLDELQTPATPLTFTHPRYRTLLEHLRQQFKQTPTLEGTLQFLGHHPAHSDIPENNGENNQENTPDNQQQQQALLADLALSSDSLVREFNLPPDNEAYSLAGTLEQVKKIARQWIQVTLSYQQEQQARQINQQLKKQENTPHPPESTSPETPTEQPEVEAIRLHYQFRNQLSEVKNI